MQDKRQKQKNIKTREPPAFFLPSFLDWHWTVDAKKKKRVVGIDMKSSFPIPDSNSKWCEQHSYNVKIFFLFLLRNV